MPKRHSSLSRVTPEGIRCRLCDAVKPASDYEACPGSRTGLRTECRDCHKASKLAAYHRRKEEIAVERKAAYAQNPEIRRRIGLASYYRHHEKRLVGKRRYRTDHPETGKAQNRRYRARLAGVQPGHTLDDLIRIHRRQRDLCFWCGGRLHGLYEPEHVIPLSRGGSDYPENLVVSCRKCNVSKSGRTPVEWIYGSSSQAVHVRKVIRRFRVRRALH